MKLSTLVEWLLKKGNITYSQSDIIAQIKTECVTMSVCLQQKTRIKCNLLKNEHYKIPFQLTQLYFLHIITFVYFALINIIVYKFCSSIIYCPDLTTTTTTNYGNPVYWM